MRPLSRALALLFPSSSIGLALVASLGYGNPLAPRPSTSPVSMSYLDQGWSATERARFHQMSQGSELVPCVWFLNLKEAGKETLLKDDLRHFGVLYDSPVSHADNPDGLPIGFARQSESQSYGSISERQWLGLTCAACHTGSIVPKEGSNALRTGPILIDGAPSMTDVAGFLTTLRDSVQATNDDPVRLQALAEAAYAAKDGESVDVIKARFHNYTTRMRKVLGLYLPQTGGPGRLDCIGAIMNRVCFDVASKDVKPAKLDAPVDFPFIWYTDRQDKIQWFGGLANGNWGARLARNVGEVTGVFAQVEARKNASYHGYKSSVNVGGLGKLDRMVNVLRPPQWSAVFPAPDPNAVDQGRKLYHDHCQVGSCHGNVATAKDPAKVSPTPLEEVGTDPGNANLIAHLSVDTGMLNGEPTFLIPFPNSLKYGPTAPAIALVGTVVAGDVLGRKDETLVALIHYLMSKYGLNKVNATAKAGTLMSKKSLATSYASPRRGGSEVVGYESRSLNGVWATAPYLHNGSVPSLEALLWPDLRNKPFYTGSSVYDPRSMGFVSDGSAGGVLFDPSLTGNSNAGHYYGAGLSDPDKWAIMAFMKTL